MSAFLQRREDEARPIIRVVPEMGTGGGQIVDICGGLWRIMPAVASLRHRLIFTLFDFSVHQFQFVGNVTILPYGIYLGVDAVSIYFVLLTTLIFPIVIISS